MEKRVRRQPQVKYAVKLSKEERNYLLGIISKGKSAAQKITRAQILLKSDESGGSKNYTDAEIANMLEVTERYIVKVRKNFVEDGLEASLNRKPLSRTKPRRLGGEEEAHLIALTCSKPPEGRSRWTLKLLADKIVELEIVDEVSPTTVGRTLKKMNLSLG